MLSKSVTLSVNAAGPTSIRLMRVPRSAYNWVAVILLFNASSSEATSSPVVTTTPLVPPAGVADSTSPLLTHFNHRCQVVLGLLGWAYGVP